VTMSWGGRSVSRGEWGESSLGSWWIHLANHIPWVFSNGVIHSGRVGCILAWMIGAGSGDVILKGVVHVRQQG